MDYRRIQAAMEPLQRVAEILLCGAGAHTEFARYFGMGLAVEKVKSHDFAEAG